MLMNAAAVPMYEPRVLDTDTTPPTPFDPNQSTVVAKGVKNRGRVAALVDLRPINHGIYQFFTVTKVVPIDQADSLRETPVRRKVYGYIHATGPNIERKHHERLFFRWGDTQPQPTEMGTWETLPREARVHVPWDTVAEYNQHLHEYWERNKRQVEGLTKRGKPWPLDAGALPHPSNFVQPNYKLQKGDLVYYLPSNQLSHPLLRPVLISRQPYRFDRASRLPVEARQCQTLDSLCPTCRVFGWVDASPKPQSDKITAYAGRLRFSHAHLMDDGDKGTFTNGVTLAILSSPKPTTTPFYLLKGDQPDGWVDYNAHDSRLRGRKVYRHHKEAKKQEYERAVDPTSESETRRLGKDDQNRTVQGVRQPGNRFRFYIDFHNLAPIELGALIWTLELKEGEAQGFHRLGLAKPLGFGSVQLAVEELDILQPLDRYSTCDYTGGWKRNVPVLDYASEFREAMSQVYEKPFHELANVQDLLSLLSEPLDLPIHYPRPDRDPDPEGRNYEWFVGNKRRQKQNDPARQPYALQLPPDDTEGLPLLRRDGNEG